MWIRSAVLCRSLNVISSGPDAFVPLPPAEVRSFLQNRRNTRQSAMNLRTAVNRRSRKVGVAALMEKSSHIDEN